jgi:hypothetical protein
MRTKKRIVNYEINNNNCFICDSHTPGTSGHIQIRVNNVKTNVHRFIYEQCFGEIPKGLVVRHKCDTPACINPEHLEIGTQADNIRDAVERNRFAKGSENHKSLLKDEQVIEIKRMLSNGGEIRIIAERFKVHRNTIQNIKYGVAWKHIN